MDGGDAGGVGGGGGGEVEGHCWVVIFGGGFFEMWGKLCDVLVLFLSFDLLLMVRSV